MNQQELTSSAHDSQLNMLLPPWAKVGEIFYGHRDWTIEQVVGLWIKVVETKSRSATPDEAWIYLPSGVVYGSSTLQRRSSHGLPTLNR